MNVLRSKILSKISATAKCMKMDLEKSQVKKIRFKVYNSKIYITHNFQKT
jgi:hypothetical protein